MTVLNTSLGHAGSPYAFTCGILVLANRPVGPLEWAGGPNRNCKVPQGWATNSHILNCWLPWSLLAPRGAFFFFFPLHQPRANNHGSRFVYWRTEILWWLLLLVSLITCCHAVPAWGVTSLWSLGAATGRSCSCDQWQCQWEGRGSCDRQSGWEESSQIRSPQVCLLKILP